MRILPPPLARVAPSRVELRNPAAVPATQVDLFTQGPGRVDVLWVVDDSGSMANQRTTLAQLGVKAMIGGTIACYLSACVAGILV